MPYSDIWHIQVHICAYMWEIYVSVYVHLYGYTCEGVRELGRRVTGGARPRKFGDCWFTGLKQFKLMSLNPVKDPWRFLDRSQVSEPVMVWYSVCARVHVCVSACVCLCLHIHISQHRLPQNKLTKS